MAIFWVSWTVSSSTLNCLFDSQLCSWILVFHWFVIDNYASVHMRKRVMFVCVRDQWSASKRLLYSHTQQCFHYKSIDLHVYSYNSNKTYEPHVVSNNQCNPYNRLCMSTIWPHTYVYTWLAHAQPRLWILTNYANLCLLFFLTILLFQFGVPIIKDVTFILKMLVVIL